MLKTVFIGAGNVAFHLAQAVHALPDAEVIQVFSRRAEKAARLSELLACTYTTDLKNTATDADLYFLAVSDGAISAVLRQLQKSPKLRKKIFVHTSGATPSDVFLPAFPRHGIFYPLQSFSLDRKPDFSTVPFCLDAARDVDFQLLFDLAAQLSKKVERVTDARRATLHVAAVFVNNFTNFMYTIGAAICGKEKVNFDLLQPLILETARKIQDNAPREMQTGPAVRGDEATITRHLNMLEEMPEFAEIYKMLTEKIRH